MRYPVTERPAALLAQLQTLTGMLQKHSERGPGVTIVFSQFMFSRGMDATGKRLEVNVPYGITSDNYRREIVDTLRGEISERLGIEIIRVCSGFYSLVEGNNIVGLFHMGGQSPLRLNGGILGMSALVDEFMVVWRELYPSEAVPLVNRFYVERDSLCEKEELLPPQQDIVRPELLFPFIGQTPAEVWKEFARSNSNVMLHLGPPGTGKSSFIQELLKARGWDSGGVYLADSDAVLTHPDFITYIRNLPRGSVVVVEDTDRLLAKREDGNQVMAGLLNSTAGIVPTSTKLLITTNLTNLNRVDPALLRAGRTHRVLHFRSLTIEQTYMAREAVGRPNIELPNQEMTLAEALNHDDGSGFTPEKFGFN